MSDVALNGLRQHLAREPEQSMSGWRGHQGIADCGVLRRWQCQSSETSLCFTIENRIQRLQALHIQVQINPAMAQQDEVTSRIHTFDMMRVAVVCTQKLREVNFDQPTIVLIGPEAIVPAGMQRPQPALIAGQVFGQIMTFPGLMNNPGYQELSF